MKQCDRHLRNICLVTSLSKVMIKLAHWLKKLYYYFCLWTKLTLICIHLNSLHPRLYYPIQVWLKMVIGSVEFFFLNFAILLLSPLERSRIFSIKKLNSLCPRMLCVKFGWYWPSGPWEEAFYSGNIFAIFWYHPLLKNGLVPHLKTIECANWKWRNDSSKDF